MPYRALFLLKLVICSFYVGASGGVFAQLSENVNECGELERAAGDAMPLSKSERIALRQQEINDLVDQVETCVDQSGQGGGGSGSGSGSGAGSAGADLGEGGPSSAGESSSDSFGNSLKDGEHSVASNTAKGSKVLTADVESSFKSEGYNAPDSGSQEPGSENGANQEALSKVDNNERLRRQLEARIEAETDPAVRAALEEKLKDLEK